jgi:hemerythrin
MRPLSSRRQHNFPFNIHNTKVVYLHHGGAGMSELAWSDEYSVGVEEIDDQHKMLFELVNRLFLAAVKREDQQLTVEVLKSLVDYTKTHFGLEERLLEESGYQGLPGHREDHLRFIAKIDAIAQKFHVEDRSVTFELINFLKHWLQNHIRQSDMEYAVHLARTGFATDAWASGARTEVRAQGLHSRPWWKFWSDAQPV